MGKVVDLFDRSRFEKLAFEKFGVMKMQDDLYMIPEYECRMVSGSQECKEFTKKVGAVEEFLEPEVIAEMRRIATIAGQEIVVRDRIVHKDNLRTVDIFNLYTGARFELTLDSFFDKPRRYHLIGLLASAIEVEGVRVSIIGFCNYEKMRKLVEKYETK